MYIESDDTTNYLRHFCKSSIDSITYDKVLENFQDVSSPEPTADDKKLTNIFSATYLSFKTQISIESFLKALTTTAKLWYEEILFYLLMNNMMPNIDIPVQYERSFNGNKRNLSEIHI